jgi:hypothetical protein
MMHSFLLVERKKMKLLRKMVRDAEVCARELQSAIILQERQKRTHKQSVCSYSKTSAARRNICSERQ